MDATIGIDLGTSAIKGALLSDDGRLLARARRATELLRPGPGRVEFAAERSYALLVETIGELVAAAPDRVCIRAIALSGATGNALLLDEYGVPLGPAISWMDTRSQDDPAMDVPGLGRDDIRAIVGWPYGRRFPLAQLAWLKRNEPQQFKRAAMAAMNIVYLYHRLTGRYGLDRSSATPFYLQNQVRRSWHRPFLDWLELSEDRLPELMDSGDALGGLTAQAARETGLPPHTVAVMGSFDHPSAARGVGALEPGVALLSCGTSWVGFYPVPDRAAALARELLVDPFLSARGGPWGGMFSLPQVGERVQAFVERAFADEPEEALRYARFNKAAAAARPGDGEPCRALMEDIAAAMKARMAALDRAGLRIRRAIMAGGPARSPAWVRILRETLELDIDVPAADAYAGALGAAILAAIGIGLFADETDGFARLRIS